MRIPPHPSSGSPPVPRPLVTTLRDARRPAPRRHPIPWPCDAACGRGWRSPMPRARHPDLIALPRRSGKPIVPILERLADWARRYTPLLAQAPARRHWCSTLTGAAHLFGGEEALLADIRARLTAMGFTPRLGHCRHAGGRRRADARKARQTGPGPRDPIIASGTEEAAFAASVAAGPARRSRDLRGAGADGPAPGRGYSLAPARALCRPVRRGSARAHRMRLWDACAQASVRGSRRRPILPSVVSSSRFLASEDVARHAGAAGGRSSAPCSPATARARRGWNTCCFVSMARCGASACSQGVRCAIPTGSCCFFRERLAGLHDALDVGHGFDLARLSAIAVGRLDETSLRLDGRARGQALARLIDTLGAPARRGTRAYSRCRRCASAGRGRAPAPPPFRTPRFRGAPPPPVPQPVPHPGSPPLPGSPPAAPDRPIRLFDQPEPIEALASVPDGPPPALFAGAASCTRPSPMKAPSAIAPPWWRGGRSDARLFLR